jgi:hypothetical protein
MNRFGWTNKSNNMKKITLNFMKTLLLALFCIVGTDVAAQSQFNPVISGGSTSGLGRAPQGSHRFTRTHFIVTAAEMTAGGFAAGEQVNGIGFSYAAAQNIATSGNIAIYLENTTDVSNVKSTTWTTAIASMTVVSNATTTIPAIVGDYNIDFSNGNTFTYTGGNLYVAFDYQNLTNALSTPNSAFCLSQTVGSAPGAATTSSLTTTPPTTASRSSFRPQVRLAFPVACARPTNLSASGATPTSANLTWDLAGASGLEVQWGNQGFTVGSGTSVTGTAVVSPFTLSGLAPSTVYDYYVRTLCTDGSISNWNGPFTFTSLFQPSNVPYNTSFENTQFPFLGWVVERDPAGNVGIFWAPINYGAGSANVQDGAFTARVGANVTTATANDWIISRGVNLTAGNTAVIEFYAAVEQNSGTTTPASYKLTVGTSQNAGAQTTVIIDAPTFSNTAYVLKSHNYVVPATGVYYFGIQNAIPPNPTGSVRMFVDNFTITQTLSTDSVDASNFVIYPNPTNDIITISSSTYSFNEVVIVDLNGRVIKSATFENVSLATLDVASLTAGVYFLNISSDEGVVNKKIIKN